uniref:YqaJ viral recombinase domain-containing protein n=1 Tax=Accipiter nisus TaxID=211598 RepID=A0A8B9RUC8_9AVES
MGRPRKDTTGTSSPRPATAASKTAPAAPPPPSTSATRANAVAAGSRSKSAPAARAANPSQRRGAKPESSQQRPAASCGARGDAGDQHRASTRSCSATQKKLPDAKGATGPARSDSRPQKQQPGAEPRRAWGQFLLPLESQDIPQVEKETRGQRSNPKWYEWRENRITASVAPRIANSKFANGKTDEVPQSYLKAVVSSSPGVQTPAMSWGLRNEKAAVRAYEQLKSQAVGKPVRVDDCGLFIHQEKNWIAASPDGIIKEVATGKALGLLEVKCPYKHRNRTVREACKDKDFCLEVDGDSYALKKDHAYFTQVQCQLAAAGFQQADFVVHTTKETAVVPVEFDAKFWGQTVPKLEKFYTEAVIPHLEEKAGGSVWAKEE